MKLVWVSLGTLVVLSVASVLTAANVVAPSRAAQQDDSIGANDLKPAECSSLSLANTVGGSGTFSGTGAADLVVASAGQDTVDGGGADDCILGGGGDDAIKGSGGTDVCVGGPGTDTFDPDCETTIQ